MMEFLTMQAPAARRAFGRSLLRHTFGHLPGDGPTLEEACTGLGRPGEDYIACYPIKKSRSHNSMAQTSGSVLEPVDGCYVITSAPDNAYCLIDTDGDGDGDLTSACCEKGGCSEGTSCCFAQVVAPLQMHHSGSSSTALSSTPSGISSPSAPALLASGLFSGCDTGRCHRLSVQGMTLLAGEHQLPQLQNRQMPTAANMAAAVEDGVGADLIGAFGSAAPDEWAAFQAAVSTQVPGPALAVASERGITLSPSAAAAASASNADRPKELTNARIRDNGPQQQQEHYQQSQKHYDVAKTGAVARPTSYPVASEVLGAASGSPNSGGVPLVGGKGGSGDSAAAAFAVKSSSGPVKGEGRDSEATEHSSAGAGSASSIVSLWAAVNSMASAAVYDSTDDNVQAGQMIERCRRCWPNTPLGSTAPSAPVVSSSSFCTGTASAVGCGGNGNLQRHDPRPPAPTPSVRTHHHYYRQEHHHRLEAYMAARYTHHTGVAVQHPALAPPLEDDDGADGAVSVPGSPAARVASCSADIGSSSVLMSVRSQLQREGGGGGLGLQPPRGAAAGGSSSASSTIDGSSSYGEGSNSVYGSGCIRAAAQARSQAHSRFSVDLHHNNTSATNNTTNTTRSVSASQPYMQHQQSQQQYAQQHVAAVVTASQHHNPGSPSRRRGAGALGLQPKPTSYTTYAYRRACSSLAASEQLAGAVLVGGSSSDDEDDSEYGSRLITAFRSHTGMMARSSGWGLRGLDSAPTASVAEAARRGDHSGPAAVVAHAGGAGGGSGLEAGVGMHSGFGGGSSGMASGEGGGGGGGGAEASNGDKDGGADGGSEGEGGGLMTRKRSSYHLTNSHAAVELFLRLNHARQTMDFVKRQTQLFADLSKAHMTVWEALQTLNELREYEAVLMAEGGEAQEISELSLLEHAFQTAELCRLNHPDLDWLHLVGLMHGLGKLLAHRRFGTQPQWAICGETYPLGCRFSPHVMGSQYFTANPDRRRRLYNTPTGVYEPGCGLLNVVMSWSAPEYLYLVLMLNRAQLPQDALWILRHAKFLSLTRPHSCYLPLCSGDDLRRLSLLRSFQSLAAFRRVQLPEGFALSVEARTAYYSELIARYVGEGPLHW